MGGLTTDDVVGDLGSGCGLFIFVCAVLYGCAGFGVELLEHRHLGAIRLLELLEAALVGTSRRIDGLVELQRGDICDVSADKLGRVTKLLLNNRVGLLKSRSVYCATSSITLCMPSRCRCFRSCYNGRLKHIWPRFCRTAL